MSSPYIGEIRMFGGNFPPAGWAFCSGQLMPISENDALFTLIGTTYGGDGQETFGIPDLQGRVPIHAGQGPGLSQTYQIGEKAGSETVTLTAQQIPTHNHQFQVSQSGGNQNSPSGGLVASSTTIPCFVPGPATAAMAANSIVAAGGNQPHDNMMPFLVVSFIISLFGIFPTQN
jgi:microcystin-dependent protein